MGVIGDIDTKKQKRKRIHVFEETLVEWRIPDFPTVARYNGSYKSYDSPYFSVAGAPFFFEMFARNPTNPECMYFFLNSKFIRDFSVEHTFGIRKLDGSVEHLQCGIMKGDEKRGTSSGNVSSEMLQQKPELIPDDVLTLTCTLKPNTKHFVETMELDNPKEFKLIKLDKLSLNFKDLFRNKETCDVTLNVKDKEYRAHKSVLIARSSVFAAAFKHDTLERQTGVITISDCDPDSFLDFLEYLYCGKLEGMSFQSALNLYYTSDKYDVEDLKIFCLEYLMQCLTVENICEVVVFADKYEETALFSEVQDFFNRNVSDILVTSEWDDLLATNRHLANKLLIEMPKLKYED